MKKVFAVILAMTMILGLSMTAFAADSPAGTTVNKVTIIDGVGADADDKEIEVGKPVTLTADKDKGKFDGWKIYKADGTLAVEGKDYTIASGASLKDANVQIIPLASIIITANYDGVVTPVKPSTGETESPETGDVAVNALAVVMLVSLAGACVAKKQLAK